MHSQVPTAGATRVAAGVTRSVRARKARKHARAIRRVRVVPLVAPPRKARGGRDVAGLIGSVAIHVALLGLILRAGLAPKQVELAEPIEVAVVETQKPAPPPPPPPPPKEEPKAPEPVKPKLQVQKLPPPPKDAPPPPPKMPDLPPPPNQAPTPEATPKAPVMIGLSMSSTTSAGSFAAPVGNTLYGAAPKTAPKPEEVKPYASASGRYVPPYKASSLPVVLNVPTLPYTPEARKLAIEGTVVLQVTVDASGKVVKVVVTRGLGHGLDEVAVKALQQAKFKPGTDGSEPIITEITYKYTFELSD